MSDVLAKAVEALKAGTDVEVAAYGESTEPSPGTEELAETVETDVELDTGELSDEVDTEEDDSESDLTPEGESEEDIDSEGEAESDSKVGEASLTKVAITDHKGRREIEVDFSDTEKMTKYVQMAALARKMQAERDSGNSKYTELETKHNELNDTWNKFEGAWGDGGREGIINLLDLINSEEGGYEGFISGEFDRLRAREKASPDQLARMDLEERLEKESRERERLMRQMKEREESLAKDKELAEDKKLEATVVPAFQKYRFAGKLGDQVAEHKLDKAIWNEVIAELDELPEGTPLTSSLVDQKFRETASFYRRLFKSEAKKSVSKSVKNKKKAASEQIATRAMQGMRPNKSAESVRDRIKSGDWGSALTDILTGKAKI